MRRRTLVAAVALGIVGLVGWQQYRSRTEITGTISSPDWERFDVGVEQGDTIRVRVDTRTVVTLTNPDGEAVVDTYLSSEETTASHVAGQSGTYEVFLGPEPERTVSFEIHVESG